MENKTNTLGLDKKPTNVHNQRRRRDTDFTEGALAIPNALLDKAFTYRWTRPEKITSRQTQDWEIVSDEKIAKFKNSIDGSTVKIYGGKDDNHREYHLVLMRKPIDWHKSDKNKVESGLKAVEGDLMSGSKHSREFGGSMYAKDGNKVGT